MTAPLREMLTNLTLTNLDGAIDASQTTLDVVDASDFPATGNFRIKIESELLLVTGVSSNTFTVVRGVESTTGASHGDSTSVKHIATAGAIARMFSDNSMLHDSSPPLGIISNGSGGLLTSSDFTWANQGSATIADENGTLNMFLPSAAGENCRVLYRTAPSPPYTFITAFQCLTLKVDGVPNWGAVFRKNSDGKLHACGFSSDSFGSMRFTMYNFNSPTSFASTQYGREDCMFMGQIFWVKLEDDNTNLKYSVSLDGVEWLLLKSIGRTSFMSGGPDQIGFYGDNSGSTTSTFYTRLVHWSTF